MNVTTFFNTQDVDNIHSPYNVWWICRVPTADSPHNWQYLLLAHWLSQYISSIQNTPCIALSSDSNPAHYSDSNCTHPLTAYRWYAHHRHEHTPAYLPHHYIHFMKSSHIAVRWLKRHFYPTLVTVYVYEKEDNKRKEGKKEGRIASHIKPWLYSKHHSPTSLSDINFLTPIFWSMHIKKDLGV